MSCRVVSGVLMLTLSTMVAVNVFVSRIVQGDPLYQITRVARGSVKGWPIKHSIAVDAMESMDPSERRAFLNRMLDHRDGTVAGIALDLLAENPPSDFEAILARFTDDGRATHLPTVDVKGKVNEIKYRIAWRYELVLSTGESFGTVRVFVNADGQPRVWHTESMVHPLPVVEELTEAIRFLDIGRGLPIAGHFDPKGDGTHFVSPHASEYEFYVIPDSTPINERTTWQFGLVIFAGDVLSGSMVPVLESP